MGRPRKKKTSAEPRQDATAAIEEVSAMPFTLVPWLVDLITGAGGSVKDIEARAEAFMGHYPDARKAGEAFLAKTVPELAELVGDRRAATALLQRAWEDWQGVRPGYNPNAVFTF